MKPNPLKAMADPDLPQDLLSHLDDALANADANIAAVTTSDRRAELESILAQISEIPTSKIPAANRLARLRFLAGQLSAGFSKNSACAKGCSHCCNIGVAVPKSEARLIARATGKRLSTPTKIHRAGTASKDARDDYFEVPCSMLKDGKCSIYEHRPLVCRTLINMDNTELLCKLVPGKSVPVPYLNLSDVQSLFVSICKDDEFADIREWFTAGSSVAK